MADSSYVRDSQIPDTWLSEVCRQYPVQRVVLDGKPTGNFLSGPVRLTFASLFERAKPMEAGKEGKFGATLLFPPSPLANLAPLIAEIDTLARSKFKDSVATDGKFYGIYTPFRDQGDKMKFKGYTPGSIFITASSNYKIPVVDSRQQEVTDPSRIYAGVWAICSLNAFTFDAKVKKGVSFGLQSVMLIADDNLLGGGAIDPKTQFGGINVTAPIVPPGQMFGGDSSEGLARPCGMCSSMVPTGQPNCAVCGTAQ